MKKSTYAILFLVSVVTMAICAATMSSMGGYYSYAFNVVLTFLALVSTFSAGRLSVLKRMNEIHPKEGG